MDIKDKSLEEIIFRFLDKCKFLFFPEQWNRTFFDYSKNEAFTLFLIYRKGKVNMTEIADYLGIPLNTATGIVSRLEKREVISRERDKEDKRIVVVCMSSSGEVLVQEQLKEFGYYFDLVIANITTEETEVVMKLVEKIFEIFKQGRVPKEEFTDTTRKVKRIPIE